MLAEAHAIFCILINIIKNKKKNKFGANLIKKGENYPSMLALRFLIYLSAELTLNCGVQ